MPIAGMTPSRRRFPVTEPALQPTGGTVSPADTLAAVASLDAASPSAVERLGRFAASLVDVSTPAGVRELLVEGMHDTLDVDSVHLVEISQDAEIGGADVSEPDETGTHRVSEHYTQTLDDRPSGVATAVRTQCPLHVPRAHGSGLVRPDHVERWNAASLLFAPLLVAGEVRLVAIGIWHEPTDSDPAAIELAVALTQIAALSLARIDAEERSRAEVRHHASLVRAARALNASLELPEVLSTLCREADFALGGDIVGVYLGDAESGGVAVAGHGAPPGWEGQVMPPGAGVAGQTLVTGRTAITNDYQSDIAASHIDQLAAVRTAVSVPVRWDDKLRGALSVGFHQLRRIAREDVLLLEAIADLAASACQNAAAYEKATAAASTDSLTGVLNHGAMQVHATREIERARRSGESLSLIVLDLDDFKALNDTYGHHAGDRFLRRAAAALDLASRPYDALARYGGDEFVLVLPGADSGQALLVAERLRASVRATTRELGLSIEVDASVGAAEWCEPLTSGELFDRADRALLLAKRRGKHNVVLAGPETDEQLALLDLDTASTSVLVREFWEGVASFDDADPRPALAARACCAARSTSRTPCCSTPATCARRAGAPGATTSGPRSRGSLTELLEAFGLKATCALPYGQRLLRRRPAAARAARCAGCCSCAPAPTSSRPSACSRPS